MNSHNADELLDQLGRIDIYLFDQLLRGRIRTGMNILDAGCGSGRNLVYFLRSGYDVRAIDEDEGAVTAVSHLFSDLAPHLTGERVRREHVESMGVDSESIDVVISSAVLHFARDDTHFDGMVREMARVLRVGGLFFCRLASLIGLESLSDEIQALGGNRYLLPDGSERYAVSEERILATNESFPASLLDPLKTTVVQGQRAMTTWVARKL